MLFLLLVLCLFLLFFSQGWQSQSGTFLLQSLLYGGKFSSLGGRFFHYPCFALSTYVFSLSMNLLGFGISIVSNICLKEFPEIVFRLSVCGYFYMNKSVVAFSMCVASCLTILWSYALTPHSCHASYVCIITRPWYVLEKHILVGFSRTWYSMPCLKFYWFSVHEFMFNTKHTFGLSFAMEWIRLTAWVFTSA